MYATGVQIKTFIKIVILIFFTFTIGLVSFVYIYFDPYITSPQRLINYKDKGIILTDRNNIPFYYINNAKDDSYVQLEDVSPYLSKAVIASEDRNFYHHLGISPQGIIRSALLNIQKGSFSYGGSTITQQLVKNTLLSPRKSIARKLEEAILAFDVESKYSKDKILEMYLNTIYYGDGAVGIEEASKLYFNKKPKDLTLSESTYLAGMLKYPSLLSPYTGDIERGIRIQKQLIKTMAKEGVITSQEEEKALNTKIAFTRGATDFENEAPHFALMVEDKLKEMYGGGVVYEGLKVKTSLDLGWQKYAQSVLKEGVDNNAGNGVGNGAVVVMDPTDGEILVLVGSKDWFNERYGRVNMATSPRQPGSSFKPIVYSLALDSGIVTPASVILDKPTKYVLDANCYNQPQSNCTYSPHNFDNKYRGPVTVRRALANSLNIPAVEIMNKVGIEAVLEKAPEFGITTLKDKSYYGKGLSLVLGSAEISPLQMTNAYAAFANLGKRPDPVLILEVRDKFDTVKFTFQPSLHQVISPEASYLITSILSDENARKEEFGSLLSTPFKAAVKTGTTDNFRDAWTIGYTPRIVATVWVGNNDAHPIYNLPGSLAAAPIWRRLMEKFVPATFRGFIKPDGIVQVPYCDTTSSDSARMEVFIHGTEPQGDCQKIANRKNRLTGFSLPHDAGIEVNESPTPTPTEQATPTPSITPTPIPEQKEAESD